jgi:hypothetical protein
VRWQWCKAHLHHSVWPDVTRGLICCSTLQTLSRAGLILGQERTATPTGSPKPLLFRVSFTVRAPLPTWVAVRSTDGTEDAGPLEASFTTQGKVPNTDESLVNKMVKEVMYGMQGVVDQILMLTRLLWSRKCC